VHKDRKGKTMKVRPLGTPQKVGGSGDCCMGEVNLGNNPSR